MGQLNSNEVPPNPFVHGWKGMVVEPPLPANPPPPRIVQTISPVQQAYHIVSQPLQPSTAAKRSSSEFPVGVLIAVGLIIALLILVFVATASARQKLQFHQSAVTNQSSIPPHQNQANVTRPLPVEQPPVLNRVKTAGSTMPSKIPTPLSAPPVTANYQSDARPVQVAQSPTSTIDRVAIPAPVPPEEPTPTSVLIRPPPRTLPLLPDPPVFK